MQVKIDETTYLQIDADKVSSLCIYSFRSWNTAKKFTLAKKFKLVDSEDLYLCLIKQCTKKVRDTSTWWPWATKDEHYTKEIWVNSDLIEICKYPVEVVIDCASG